MSQSSVRQSELFAGEDWTVLYRAFTQVNFNASDPASINRALREYIQSNYPEDFNDWIESQEFVFIIELLSWLAGTLAFKTDINARENFLETAEARESILKLARFLSYNTRRNSPATGLLKLVEVKTDDDVIDGFGNNLSNIPVRWNDIDDPEWKERFVLIMNSAFIRNNQYGQPLKTAVVANRRNHLYRINSMMQRANMGFSAFVSGTNMDFELCNGDFSVDRGYYERSPDLTAAPHVFYCEDGAGHASKDTGFFFLFKQGTLSRDVVNVPLPVENKIIPLDTPNINQTDVWVQTIDDNGNIMIEWTQTPTLSTDNNTFNSIPAQERNIFTAVTKDEDRVDIRFSDGRFGNAPVGNIRTWYRVSNGMRYTIRAQDITRVTIPIPYVNANGVPRTLTMTLSLQDNVSNSVPRETDDQVRRRAPMVYSTQNRMISGEDYNTFPLQSNIAAKMKAVNRIYSGHSRYIDLNDPTGMYQDIIVYSDDGMIYRDHSDYSVEVPLSLNRTPDEMVAVYIMPVLARRSTAEYVTNILIDDTGGTLGAPNVDGLQYTIEASSAVSTRGYFDNLNSTFNPVSAVVRGIVQPGAMIEMKNGDWAGITEVDSPDIGAPTPTGRKGVVLNKALGTTLLARTVKRFVPRYNSAVGFDIANSLVDRFENNRSFGLWFKPYDDGGKYVVVDENVTVPQGILVLVSRYIDGSMWRITARGSKTVFASQNKVEWYFDGSRAADDNTGLQRRDIVSILGINPNLNGTTGMALGHDYDLDTNTLIYSSDGYADPSKISVSPIDRDEDGVPDDPNAFMTVVSTNPKQSTLFWIRSNEIDAPIYNVKVFDTVSRMNANVPTPGDVAYVVGMGSFYDGVAGNPNKWVASPPSKYIARQGRGANNAASWTDASGTVQIESNPIAFKWEHFADSDHRIDPAKTNIIDIFVLTTEYDFALRRWIAAGATPADRPEPPSELDLRIALQEFDQYKAFSDEIVWRPARYKTLFGQDSESPCQFKVIKVPSATLSDGEIRSRIIRAINEFFAVDNWDFGETFYFTELAAYVHQRLAGVISSFVLVPSKTSDSFGDGFETVSRSDEVFISTAQVSDVVLINSNTADTLRIR